MKMSQMQYVEDLCYELRQNAQQYKSDATECLAELSIAALNALARQMRTEIGTYARVHLCAEKIADLFPGHSEATTDAVEKIIKKELIE
jgi:hypothetical protein